MKYFAYGEKMFSPQLLNVVPGAMILGVAKVIGYKLYFHKSCLTSPAGKCNIIAVPDRNCEVYGVLYNIPTEDQPLLDRAEGVGLGTTEIPITVYPLDQANNVGPQIYAFTYIAHKEVIFEDLVPFTWYKELVIYGAKEHHLPKEYIHHLEQYATMVDQDRQRAGRQKKYLDLIAEKMLLDDQLRETRA
jgi:hypothetical protein